MRRILNDLYRLFLRDEGGNVFILFAATAVPILLIIGGAVDITRYSRYKTDLANAVDAAALALARQGSNYTEEQATVFVTNYVTSFPIGDDKFSVESFDVEKLDNGFVVTANGAMETIFLPLGGLTRGGASINSMDVNIVAEVVNSSNRVELAIVVDNTGSMNCGATLSTSCVDDWASPASTSRIASVKTAAKTLVDILMPDNLDDKNLVKIAIVPFEGQVNAASSGFSVTSPPNWIDWADTAAAKWNGINFDKRNTSTGAVCTTGTNCKYVGHKFLFNKLTTKFPTVKWAGCVEMRAGTYELSDAAPHASIPDSLFVPYLAPDEPDSPTTAGSSGATRHNYDSNGSSSGGTQYTYKNDYLNDQSVMTPVNSNKAFTKYTVTNPAFWSGRMDVEGLNSPYEYGPNRGCPRPIYPLANANSKATIKTEINSMIAYWSSGTFLPPGLIWGWHVLSPGIPYTEGTKPGDQYYDKTVKAIVFFTDGENDVTDDSNPNKSRYNAYSYVNTNISGTYRLGSTAAASITALNTKLATLCTNVKADNIRLYVVTFGTLSSANKTMMTNCATLTEQGDRLYYHAPATSDLNDIFRAIGQDLSDIHLSM